MVPSVTVPPNPFELPMAITLSPTRKASALPNLRAVSGLLGLTQQGAFNPAGLVEEIPGLNKLPGIGSLLGGQQPAGDATQPGVNVPGVGNVPGVNNVPGLGGLLGGKQQQPQQPDASQPGGVLPGVGDLLGGQKQQQQAPAVNEPGAT